MGQDEFYITLSNTDSTDYFSTNTSTDFYVKLPYLIELDPSWLVGVNQMWLEKRWYNIEDCSMKMYIKPVPDVVFMDDTLDDGYEVMKVITPGYYMDGSDLIKEMNNISIHDGVSLCEFVYNDITHKISITLNKGVLLNLNDKLKKILGSKTNIIKDSCVFERPVNVHIYDNLLFMHTNIISNQMYGNTMPDVLKIINTNNIDYNGVIYDNVVTNYARVVMGNFDVIHIQIKNTEQHAIKSCDCRIVLQLHFRRG